jgi:hypothetical protein
MPSLELEFKGMDALERNLRALAAEMPDEINVALYQEAEIEMTEAKQRTPVDTGSLRNSGVVQRLDGDAGVRLGFGGPAADYAVYVHENLEAHHPTGQAKFLESVLVESAPSLPKRIAERVQRLIARHSK